MLKEISINSDQKQQILDITQKVQDIIKSSNIKQGIAIIYCPHTTGAITINENYDNDVKRDMIFALNKFVPEKGYNHSEGNSDGHIKSSLIGVSKTIPINDSKLMLGTWQGILFCEFDGPRQRKILIKIQGD